MISILIFIIYYIYIYSELTYYLTSLNTISYIIAQQPSTIEYISKYSLLYNRYCKNIQMHACYTQELIHGASCISMDTVNILDKNCKKINIYYYYPVRKGQVMVENQLKVLDQQGINVRFFQTYLDTLKLKTWICPCHHYY